MTETVYVLNIIAISQGFFLGMVLAFKKNDTLANRILSTFILAVTFSMMTNYFHLARQWTALYYMLYVNLSFYLLYGPLMYLYTLAITRSMKKSLAGYLWHLAPFAIFFLYMIVRHRIIEWSGEMDFRPFYLNDRLLSYPNLVIVFLIVLLGYVSRSQIIIRRYKKRLKNYFSDVEKISLVWLSMLLFGTSIFSLLLIAFLVIFRDLTVNYFNSQFVLVIYISYLATLYMLAFFTIRYPEIFNSKNIGPLKENGEKAPKYEKLRLDDDLRLNYCEQLLHMMKTRKPYLHDSLTLKDLAEMLKIPRHHLSIIINSDLKQNFFMFINGYRIEEAKKMLTHPEYRDMNILNIAFNSGFNSKTTFNTIFKQITGMTPSQFRSRSLSPDGQTESAMGKAFLPSIPATEKK